MRPTVSSHDQLDDVERIGADVVDEVGVAGDGLGVQFKLLGQDVSDFFEHDMIPPNVIC